MSNLPALALKHSRQRNIAVTRNTTPITPAPTNATMTFDSGVHNIVQFVWLTGSVHVMRQEVMEIEEFEVKPIIIRDVRYLKMFASKCGKR